MSFEQEIEDSIKDGFVKQIADKILQEIDEISNKPTAPRRWVWELLQNAKDVPNNFNGVSVKIELTSDSLNFSHNGNPFTINNLTHLIQQVSSKYKQEASNENTTGKYGTGFIATHTLSKIIKVKGFVKNNDGITKEFSFELDRSPSDQVGMMNKIRDNLDLLKRLSDDTLYPANTSFQYRNEDFKTTQFIYPLSPKSKEFALEGLGDLDYSIPVTLCILNQEIKSVEVRNYVKDQHWSYKVTNTIHLNGITKYEVTRTDLKTVGNNKVQHILVSADSNVIVALTLKEDNNGSFKIKPRSVNSSVLFKEFPLIGSQDFYFPAFIQSALFEPTKDRDGLFLKEDDQEIVINNRGQIVKALELYIKLFTYENVLTYGNPHLLAISRLPNNKQDYINEEWYTNNIQIKLRAFLLDLPLVEVHNNSGGKRRLIKDCKFPFIPDNVEKTNQFWELCSYALGNQVPNKDNLGDWISIITPEYDTWNYDLKFTLSDLLIWIKECGTIEKLEESLTGIESITWLNNVINFLCNNGYKSDLEKHEIIPNQNHELKLIRDLVFDKDLPPVLIDILKEISIDWRDTLIHKGIVYIEGHQEFSIKDISSKINEVIIPFNSKTQSALSPDKATEPVKIGILKLASCITSEESTSRRKIFEFAQIVLPEITPLAYQVVPNTSDFNWEPVNKFVLTLVLYTLSECKTVSAFSVLTGKTDTESLQFINDLHNFLASSKEHEPLLSYYNTIPNQQNEFSNFVDLYAEAESISDDLKDILLGLDSTQDWKKILINNSLSIRLNKFKKLEEICNTIDNLVKERRINETLDDKITKSHVLNLIKIIIDNGSKYENLLKFTYMNKANLFMDMFENTSLKDSLFRIMQDENLVKNLDDISKLKLSNEQLVILVDAIQRVGIDKVLEQIAELVEKESYFHDMKILGDLAEEAFRKSFEALGLQVKIHSTEGACDFLIIKPDLSEYSVEIKSCTIEKPYISMYPSQAQKAVLNPTKFALCVLERNIPNPTLDYFRTNARFVIDIGIILADKQKRASEYGQYMDNIRQEYVTIDYENPTYKFIVKRPVWETKLSFWQFVEYIKASFIQ